MGYRVHTAEDQFKVVEVVEGEVRDIKIGEENEIRSLQKHLNFGGGFDGWTPEFFLQKIAI